LTCDFVCAWTSKLLKRKSRSRREKKERDRIKRAEIWSFWLLREPQFNLDHYELRYANPFGVTWSEKCSREVHRSRAQRRNSETTVKEELNATKIVFIRTCREPRSVQLIPQKVRADFTRRWNHRRRFSARTWLKLSRKPEICGWDCNPDHYLNSTVRTMLIWQREREYSGSEKECRKIATESCVRWSGKS